MAAFEAVSKVELERFDPELEIIDVRRASLPFDRRNTLHFDPREYRDPKNPIKPWMAYFNMLRSSFNAGMLGIPMAISQVGIVLGPIMTILVGILMIHTHLTLLWCLNEISRQMKVAFVSYRYGFRMAVLHGPPCFHCVGRHGPTLVAVFMILSQLGICTVFVILTADNVRDMFDFKSIVPALLILYIPYIILEALMRSLEIISYASMFGNILNLVGMSLVFYLIMEDPHGEIIYASGFPLSWFLAFGMMLFNLSSIGVILSCEKALKHPQIMSTRKGVVVIGMAVPTVVSAIYGSLGYWSFGTMEENVLRSLPFDHTVTQVTFGVYLVSLATAYPIQCYPAMQIILEIFKNNDPRVVPDAKSLNLLEHIERPLFVTATFIIAYFLPFQASFVAFVGNLCTTLLSLVFPVMMEIGILYPNGYGTAYYMLIKDLLILILGVVTWIFGVWLCGYHLYILIIAKQSPNNDEYL